MGSFRRLTHLKLYWSYLLRSSVSLQTQQPLVFFTLPLKPFFLQNPKHNHSTFLTFSAFSSSASVLRSFSTAHENQEDQWLNETLPDEAEGDMVIEEWEEEDETEPEIGDGGAGGGIVLQNVPWGERALSIAQEVLLQFGDDMKLFSFKATPRGYIYMRLDKLTTKYGCPSMEEIESYSQQYKKRLDEEGSKGNILEDIALEVSSPGAERLLRVPDDLQRFKDFPMMVTYNDIEAKAQEKSAVFFLDSIETETEQCVWKLADVRENRDPATKGKPLSRKQKDWRLKLPYSNLNKVTLYIEF